MQTTGTPIERMRDALSKALSGQMPHRWTAGQMRALLGAITTPEDAHHLEGIIASLWRYIAMLEGQDNTDAAAVARDYLFFVHEATRKIATLNQDALVQMLDRLDQSGTSWSSCNLRYVHDAYAMMAHAVNAAVPAGVWRQLRARKVHVLSAAQRWQNAEWPHDQDVEATLLWFYFMNPDYEDRETVWTHFEDFVEALAVVPSTWPLSRRDTLAWVKRTFSSADGQASATPHQLHTALPALYAMLKRGIVTADDLERLGVAAQARRHFPQAMAALDYAVHPSELIADKVVVSRGTRSFFARHSFSRNNMEMPYVYDLLKHLGGQIFLRFNDTDVQALFEKGWDAMIPRSRRTAEAVVSAVDDLLSQDPPPSADAIRRAMIPIGQLFVGFSAYLKEGKDGANRPFAALADGRAAAYAPLTMPAAIRLLARFQEAGGKIKTDGVAQALLHSLKRSAQFARAVMVDNEGGIKRVEQKTLEYWLQILAQLNSPEEVRMFLRLRPSASKQGGSADRAPFDNAVWSDEVVARWWDVLADEAQHRPATFVAHRSTDPAARYAPFVHGLLKHAAHSPSRVQKLCEVLATACAEGDLPRKKDRLRSAIRFGLSGLLGHGVDNDAFASFTLPLLRQMSGECRICLLRLALQTRTPSGLSYALVKHGATPSEFEDLIEAGMSEAPYQGEGLFDFWVRLVLETCDKEAIAAGRADSDAQPVSEQRPGRYEDCVAAHITQAAAFQDKPEVWDALFYLYVWSGRYRPTLDALREEATEGRYLQLCESVRRAIVRPARANRSNGRGAWGSVEHTCSGIQASQGKRQREIALTMVTSRRACRPFFTQEEGLSFLLDNLCPEDYNPALGRFLASYMDRMDATTLKKWRRWLRESTQRLIETVKCLQFKASVSGWPQDKDCGESILCQKIYSAPDCLARVATTLADALGFVASETEATAHEDADAMASVRDEALNALKSLVRGGHLLADTFTHDLLTRAIERIEPDVGVDEASKPECVAVA